MSEDPEAAEGPETHRLRIDADGVVRLPPEVVRTLGWEGASHLELEVHGGVARLRRIEVDPFAEALETPSPDAFEKILERQRKSRDAAFETFDARMKEPPPTVRPEDRPDHWR